MVLQALKEAKRKVMAKKGIIDFLYIGFVYFYMT